ncbi:MAG TPA: hypothetical protein VFD46_13825 [Chryseolinea sp.]|nr:hypothetical protein [Chryseolinea sp.]
MRKIVLVALFISNVIYSFGQNAFGVKIYQNTDIFETQYYESRTMEMTKVKNVNFNRITFAVDIDTKKGYTHEIEFLIPEISKPLENIQFPLNYEFRKDETFDGEASSYSFRYEVSKTLTNKAKRFSFLLGAGINPYYVHIEYEPNVETTYYSSTQLYGFALNITPRISYRVSQRFSVDLNVPLKIYDLRGEKNKTENPAIPIRQQTTNDYSNIFFENAYTIRFGLMYKLNK